jgi:hypothetical protein
MKKQILILLLAALSLRAEEIFIYNPSNGGLAFIKSFSQLKTNWVDYQWAGAENGTVVSNTYIVVSYMGKRTTNELESVELKRIHRYYVNRMIRDYGDIKEGIASGNITNFISDKVNFNFR